jgi:formate hydrogenlyase transcriptional activator
MAKRLNTKMKRIWRMARCAAFSPVRKRCTATLRSSAGVAAACGEQPLSAVRALLHAAAGGGGPYFGGCEFIRTTDQPWSEAEYERLHTFTQIVAVVAEQIQSRVTNNVDYDLLSRERDNFRILVAITNAVLSRLDMDELVSEVSKEIHHYFKIDAISIALRSHRKGKLNIYSTHYLDEANPAHEQSEVDEAGTLSERVFKSKEILLLNLNEQDPVAPYERMLFNTWGNKIQTLCLLPLMSGNTMLGVLKLAQCDEGVFHRQPEAAAPDRRAYLHRAG